MNCVLTNSNYILGIMKPIWVCKNQKKAIITKIWAKYLSLSGDNHLLHAWGCNMDISITSLQLCSKAFSILLRRSWKSAVDIALTAARFDPGLRNLFWLCTDSLAPNSLMVSARSSNCWTCTSLMGFSGHKDEPHEIWTRDESQEKR